VAGYCKHGNEISYSIKGREFCDQLSVVVASQEGLCSMELVTFSMDSLILNLIEIHPVTLQNSRVLLLRSASCKERAKNRQLVFYQYCATV
jgi:hypothetical protein